MKNNKRCLLLGFCFVSVFAIVGTFADFGANISSAVINNNIEEWFHYPAIEPTKTEAGIKEYYVSCSSHEHTFVAPQSFKEGEWTEIKKSEIRSDKSDDRRIYSFNELDDTLDGVTGSAPFDFVKIKTAKEYINNNYSEATKGLYAVESNLVYNLEDYYNLTFNKCFNMENATFHNANPKFSVTKQEDSIYDYFLNITINQDIETGTNPSFAITNFTEYLSQDNQSISFAVYSSEEAEFNLGLSYSDKTSQYMNFKFSVGWNHFSFAKGSTNYNYFTNAAGSEKTIAQLAVALVKTHNAGNVIKFASFIGECPLSAGEIVKHKIANLPTQENLSPYDICKINDLLEDYEELDADEKAKVTNYSTLTSLKTYWDSLYVLLYDMGSSYAGINSNAGLDKRISFNNDYGYTLYASVQTGGTFIDLNNTNHAYTAEELSKIIYRVRPNMDCFMSWSNINNYGRSDDTEIPLTANVWNEYAIQGTRSSVSNVTQFLNYAMNNNTMRNDFVPTTDKWGHYLVGDVGFSYQMSSIIGVKKVDEEVTNTINLINSTCIGTPELSKAQSLAEIDIKFNNLSTTQKEQVTNIEQYYSYKDLFSQSFPYMYSSSVKLHSWYQTGNLTDDDITYGVNTNYGYAYSFSWLKLNYGTNITFDTGLGTEVENNGFYLFIKGFSSTLKIFVHEPAYSDTPIATANKELVGDGWYKYSFTKADYDALIAAGCLNYRVSYCFNGTNQPGVKVLMSGTYFVPVTDGTSRASVQSHINTVNSLTMDEFLGPKITEVQKEIVGLSTFDQAALSGQNNLNTKYTQYKQKYESVYSMGVYRVGKWWTGSVESITKSYDANYGDIYSVISNTTQGPYLTIGSWALNGTKGSHRGYGKEIAPLPEGKYKSVSFAIYIPHNDGGTIYLKGWNDNDVSFDILSQTLTQGWNKITFTGDNLDKLCGSLGSFKGISIVLPAKSEQSYEYKISSFVGEKNPDYTGETEHYAQNSLHQGSYNIDSTQYQMVASKNTDYRFVVIDNGASNDAINFINKHLNKATGATIPIVSSATPSSHSRYIFFNNTSAMAAMGVPIISKDILGETGYTITTLGSSIYIFAYGSEGYELAASKFLEATIGYDWLSNDMVNYEKNGTTYSSSITVYTPDFHVVEKPDYDDRYHSNAPNNHNYGSTLEQPKVYNPSCCNAPHYLPTDESGFQDCYWKIKYDEETMIDSSVLCFNAKGNSARRAEMVKTVGDIMIEQSKLNLGYKYAGFFQGDTSETCQCDACLNDINNHGSAAYSEISFLNDVDTYIKNNYTEKDIKIIFLVYQATLNPPTGISCHDNVVPYIAPSGARWNHSFYEIENSSGIGEEGYIYDNDFAGKIKSWTNICSEYVMWAYQALNANFVYVYNTFESMYDQYRFFYNNGCKAMNSEGVTAMVSSGYITLKDYLDSKAMFDVNGSYDEVYEKFFKYYYGAAGEQMRIIFDESIANLNFLAENYGRGSYYNPESHPTKSGSNYYYDGSMNINSYCNYDIFWNNTGDCYNGNNGKCNGKNIANLPYWITLANEAVSLTEHGDATIFKHVQRDVIFPYYCDQEINKTGTYVGRICKYCYDTGCYWDNELRMRNDHYIGLTGTHTICYLLTGKTFEELYGK